jgi:hypothetical protein
VDEPIGQDVRHEVMSMQLVKVQRGELSVHPGSYLGGGKGDRAVEASGKGAHEGGNASVRAATRVKPEQASKGSTGAPNLRPDGEGRRDRLEEPTEEDLSALRGIGRSTHTSIDVERGRPDAGPQGNQLDGVGQGQESEEPIVPRKPGNAAGGKGLWFEERREESRGRRSA